MAKITGYKLLAQGEGRYRLLAPGYFADFTATIDLNAKDGWHIEITNTNGLGIGAIEFRCREMLASL